MPSNMDLKMNSQEANGAKNEHREANIPTGAENAKASTSEPPPATSAAEADKKTGKANDDKKKLNGKCGKKHNKAKAKKGKKPAEADNSSSDENEDASSGDSTDSDVESETEVKKKRVVKKRQDTQKPKKVKSAKKSKKQIKTAETSSDSDDDESESDGDDEKLEKGHGQNKHMIASLQQQVQQLQLTCQAMQQQMQRQPAGVPYGNMFGSANPGVNLGSWNGLPLSSNPLGSASLGSGGLNYGGADTGLTGRNPNMGNLNLGLGGVVPSRRGGRRGRGHGGTAAQRSSRLILNDEEEDASFDEDGLPAFGKSSKNKHDTVPQRLDFKRVDQVWDSQIHNYKLQDTAVNDDQSQHNEYLFHVRRTFDWEGKYKATVVDIKTKQLREALHDVIGNIKGVSLVEEVPKLDPNMLFLYLEDFREHLRNLKELEPEGKSKKERKKVQRWIDEKRKHLKVLVKYLDKDYAQIKESLYPLLENGLITMDLCWALWKPNTLAYTTTYGSTDEPRVLKVEVAEKHYSIIKGDFYYIEGKYFEYDGKQFGFGTMSDEIGDFRGARKITSLNCYPLKYHKNETRLRKDLIERGKKFVSLSGVNYKSHQGMAYYKKKKTIVKVNINGRIMVDASIHRRTNPNYPISLVRPNDHDIISDEELSDDEDGCCCESDDSDVGSGHDGQLRGDEDDKVKYITKIYQDKNGQVHTYRLPQDEVDDAGGEKLDVIPDSAKENDDKTQEKADGDKNDEGAKNDTKETPEFTDEEYLIASPVVLGFAFTEKLWLEFTVSGVKEISWNEQAYDSLVLEPKTKSIVKALVESHKYHAAESIDDVIQGKGKGLIAVLHGPPGTGKTLTAEGISELLKCPLYCVSAGDLGTDSRYLESELQKILDICHAWGAILLLDEADVFLEKRNMQDIHRNALVSIFLRQLEYFQGILFLTTNRVETFDDAFQSRIHIALPYADLDTKAKKAIFKIFIERVRILEKVDLMPFDEEDYEKLARHNLNGRQIKNTIRTAQALAVNKGEPLSMVHIREVLGVLKKFERDLKGGTGYEDAMKGYM